MGKNRQNKNKKLQKKTSNNNRKHLPSKISGKITKTKTPFKGRKSGKKFFHNDRNSKNGKLLFE